MLWGVLSAPAPLGDASPRLPLGTELQKARHVGPLPFTQPWGRGGKGRPPPRFPARLSSVTAEMSWSSNPTTCGPLPTSHKFGRAPRLAQPPDVSEQAPSSCAPGKPPPASPPALRAGCFPPRHPSVGTPCPSSLQVDQPSLWDRSSARPRRDNLFNLPVRQRCWLCPTSPCLDCRAPLAWGCVLSCARSASSTKPGAGQKTDNPE